MTAPFRRVAVIGTGLIGGSFALAFRKHFPSSMVVGWDKTDVLRHAVERGAIHEGIPELSSALADADLVSAEGSNLRPNRRPGQRNLPRRDAVLAWRDRTVRCDGIRASLSGHCPEP